MTTFFSMSHNSKLTAGLVKDKYNRIVGTIKDLKAAPTNPIETP